MAQDMGRGILAPENIDDIQTGAAEMRTLAATAALAISDSERAVREDVAEWYLPRDEASRFGIEGPEGKPGEPGLPGPPGTGGAAVDTSVAGMLDAPNTETGAKARELFAARSTTPTASSQTVEHWVSPVGDDSNEGTQARPFRTIAKAVSLIPDVIRSEHTHTVVLEPGTWEEGITPAHKVAHGLLLFKGSSEGRSRHKVDVVRPDTILGNLEIRNITTTRKTASGASFRFYRCAPMAKVDNCASESNSAVEKGVEGVIGLLADYGSQVIVTNSDFGGKRYGMRANYLSRIFSRDNTGTNNSFGLGARWGGILTTYGTQPAGDTSLTTDSGGIISQSSGGKIGFTPEPGLVSVAGLGDNAPTVKRYQLNSAVAVANENLASPQKIRARFRVPNDGYTFFRVTYAAQTSLTGSQSIEKNMYGVIRRTEIAPALKSTSISNDSMSGDNLQLVHVGADGYVDLIVSPSAALAGRWGLDVEVTFHRNVPGPILESFVVLPS